MQQKVSFVELEEVSIRIMMKLRVGNDQQFLGFNVSQHQRKLIFIIQVITANRLSFFLYLSEEFGVVYLLEVF